MIASLGIVGTLVQTGSSFTGQTLTTTREIPAGRLLVAGSVSLTTANTSSSPTGQGAGNSWTSASADATNGTGVTVGMWFLPVQVKIPTATALTFNWGTAAASALGIYEYGGLSSDLANWGVDNNAGGNALTSITSGAVALGVTSRYAAKQGLLIACCGLTINAAQTAASGYFNQSQSAIGTVGHYQFQEQTKAVTVGTETAGSSWSGSASVSLLAAFLVLGPERAHDSEQAAWTRRASGLVVPRRAVYRSRR